VATVAPVSTMVGRHQRTSRRTSAAAVAGIAAARAHATWPASRASAVTTTAGPIVADGEPSAHPTISAAPTKNQPPESGTITAMAAAMAAMYM
jgi:hypothetical protein